MHSARNASESHRSTLLHSNSLHALGTLPYLLSSRWVSPGSNAVAGWVQVGPPHRLAFAIGDLSP